MSNVLASRISPNLDSTEDYENNQQFGAVFQTLRGALSRIEVEKDRWASPLSLFSLQDCVVVYRNWTLDPRKRVRDVLSMAHDSQISGHFGVTETLAWLQEYHWKSGMRDFKRYCGGSLVCQQQKNSREKRFSFLQPLEVFEHL